MRYVDKYYVGVVLFSMMMVNVFYAFFFSKDFASAIERSYFQAILSVIIILAPKNHCIEEQ